ncbi:MAG TPA: hydrolase TatD [Bacteroidales bacterium]|jgi:TatD DNase family protein|nr:hydrolase TatD [Bacteroidales bacterium]HBZ21893.1 hydrolase TatD [Bacteroidales bacterium]
MQLIDTHTHIYLPEFNDDRDESVKRAVQSGVVKQLMPNIDIDSVSLMLSVENNFPGICFPMIGLHPTSVKEDYVSQLDQMEELAATNKFYAIGEIGIDLYWDKSRLTEQILAFKRQVAFAVKSGLPVVIHSRDSFPEVFKALEPFKGADLKGVFHAFTGSSEDAEKAIGLGFKLGIGGIVTFKNSGLEKVVSHSGVENLILETDSPYLAPVPYRGKRNESSYLCIINNRVAEILGLSNEETADVTYNNSVRLFGL